MECIRVLAPMRMLIWRLAGDSTYSDALYPLILNGMPSLPITLSKEDSFSADSPLADDDTSPQTASSVCCSLIINLDLNQARMVVCPFIPLMPFYGLFPRLTRESSLLSLFSA